MTDGPCSDCFSKFVVHEMCILGRQLYKISPPHPNWDEVKRMSRVSSRSDTSFIAVPRSGLDPGSIILVGTWHLEFLWRPASAVK